MPMSARRLACSTVEQGQATRSEAALKAERDLGDPGSLATRKTSPRLALFNLVIDSKLRGCDLVGLRVHDVVHGSRVAALAIVVQKKTERPVQFEITEQTRDAIAAGITASHKGHADLPSDQKSPRWASADLDRVHPNSGQQSWEGAATQDVSGGLDCGDGGRPTEDGSEFLTDS